MLLLVLFFLSFGQIPFGSPGREGCFFFFFTEGISEGKIPGVGVFCFSSLGGFRSSKMRPWLF